MSDGLLLPQPDEHSAPFWEGCLAGELRVQRCAQCDRPRMPPRPMCPHCGSFEHRWEATSGRGRIWSFVVPHPPLLPAYEELLPYVVAVVELQEDPTIRFVGMVRGIADPDAIAVGDPVTVTFDPHSEDIAVPGWNLV